MDGGHYRRLDLGCGTYRFKRELSNVHRDTGRGFVGVISSATLLRSVTYSMRDVAEHLQMGRVSELPGKVMRRIGVFVHCGEAAAGVGRPLRNPSSSLSPALHDPRFSPRS